MVFLFCQRTFPIPRHSDNLFSLRRNPCFNELLASPAPAPPEGEHCNIPGGFSTNIQLSSLQPGVITNRAPRWQDIIP